MMTGGAATIAAVDQPGATLVMAVARIPARVMVRLNLARVRSTCLVTQTPVVTPAQVVRTTTLLVPAQNLALNPLILPPAPTLELVG